MDKPGYYAVIPATVRYDTRLCANAKLLYGEISALCNESGYCYASNTYFAEKFVVNKVSISRWIKQLIEYGYIFSKIEYAENSNNIESRILYLREVYIPINKIVNTPYQNCYDPINKIVKENNKIEYIKEINKEKLNDTPKRNTKKVVTDFKQFYNDYKYVTNNEELKNKLDEWFEYKKERNEEYVERGLKTFLTRINKNVDMHGTDAVIDLIDESMSNQWKGVIFDKLKNNNSNSHLNEKYGGIHYESI